MTVAQSINVFSATKVVKVQAPATAPPTFHPMPGTNSLCTGLLLRQVRGSEEHHPGRGQF